MRTVFIVDSVSLTVADHAFAIWSVHDGFVLATWDRSAQPLPGPNQPGLFQWSRYSSRLQEMSPRYGDGSLSNILSWVVSDQTKTWHFAVHYQWLVLFLTLLSAYLILWKPRKREAHRISEGNSN